MYTSRAIAVVITSVILPLLASIVLGLRLQTRKGRALGFSSDEYLIIAALLVTIAGSVVYVIGALGGGIGAHIETLTPNQFVENGKVLFALQFFYIGSVALVKLSVLQFYKRIFISRGFKLAANTVVILVVAWLVAFFFATLFQAWPISYNWTQIGHPTNYLAIYYSCDALDLFIDVVTLSLPLPSIKKLRISIRKKWMIASVFLLGAFACVSSAVRLYYLTRFTDPSLLLDFPYNTTNLVIWSTIEPNISIIAACLPTLAPVVKDFSSKSIVQSARYYLSFISSSSSLGKSQKMNIASDNFNGCDSNGARKDGFNRMAKDIHPETRSCSASQEDDIEMDRVGQKA